MIAQFVKQGMCLKEYDLRFYHLVDANGFVKIYTKTPGNIHPQPDQLVAIIPAHAFDCVDIIADEDHV